MATCLKSPHTEMPSMPGNHLTCLPAAEEIGDNQGRIESFPQLQTWTVQKSINYP